MTATTLRKVGGSIMMVVPRAILEQLDLKAGATVALAVEGERIIVEPSRRPRYTLDELLSELETDAVKSQDDREWLHSASVGRELL